ncbi:MAG: 50S ribosomal protein L11 methyltransferase [Chloroflexota bacterium]
MNYVEVVIVTDPETADQLITPLTPFAEGGSVAVEQLGNPEDLNPTAMLPESTVKFWFEEGNDSNDFRRLVKDALQDFTIQSVNFTLLDSIDWTTEWRKNFKPITAGEHFIILPPWEENITTQRTPIFIDPGIAFGTGQHETTRLCISLLEQKVESKMRVLDLGAGSGILSMACAHLGAENILAVEIDGDAVQSAAENLQRNGLEDKIKLVHGGLDSVSDHNCDLIVANILAVILIDLIKNDNLLEKVKVGGRLIFSGIIDQQLEEFKEVISQPDFVIEQIVSEGEWVALSLLREL